MTLTTIPRSLRLALWLFSDAVRLALVEHRGSVVWLYTPARYRARTTPPEPMRK